MRTAWHTTLTQKQTTFDSILVGSYSCDLWQLYVSLGDSGSASKPLVQIQTPFCGRKLTSLLWHSGNCSPICLEHSLRRRSLSKTWKKMLKVLHASASLGIHTNISQDKKAFPNHNAKPFPRAAPSFPLLYLCLPPLLSCSAVHCIVFSHYRRTGLYL